MFLNVVMAVKFRSEMLKEAVESYWTMSKMSKTRCEHCRAVSACVSFLWKKNYRFRDSRVFFLYLT